MAKVAHYLGTGMAVLAVVAGCAFLNRRSLPIPERLKQRVSGKYTVEDRLRELGPGARERWWPYFESAGLKYPSRHLLLVGLKQEKRLEVYGRDAGAWKFVRSLPVLAASGELGPKLREGDRQVPEGMYCVESLNPNSRFHLALRVNYPNEFDRQHAEAEGRENPGKDIMIHGSNVSIGCLAMGDEAAEDLFILAAEKWPQKIEILLCPVDFRNPSLARNVQIDRDWMRPVYQQLQQRLKQLPSES